MRGALSDRWVLGLALVAMATANVAANRLVPDLDVAIGIALTIALLLLARAGRVTWDELGLARSTWGSGVRWGMAAASVVTAVYLLALAVPAAREAVSSAAGPTSREALVAVAVVIPLAVVIPEELAFRGLLWSLLRRGGSVRRATVVSSLLFGLWHLLPAGGSGAANTAVDQAVGGGAGVVRVAGTVVVTFVAGVILCLLRHRSRSLVAPLIAHWAVNGVGTVVVLLV